MAQRFEGVPEDPDFGFTLEQNHEWLAAKQRKNAGCHTLSASFAERVGGENATSSNPVTSSSS